MHKTTSGEKRKALRKEARELQEEADRLQAEAEALKDRARLEDLSIWTMLPRFQGSGSR